VRPPERNILHSVAPAFAFLGGVVSFYRIAAAQRRCGTPHTRFSAPLPAIAAVLSGRSLSVTRVEETFARCGFRVMPSPRKARRLIESVCLRNASEEEEFTVSMQIESHHQAEQQRHEQRGAAQTRSGGAEGRVRSIGSAQGRSVGRRACGSFRARSVLIFVGGALRASVVPDSKPGAAAAHGWAHPLT
jgi:hypothetical protein